MEYRRILVHTWDTPALVSIDSHLALGRNEFEHCDHQGPHLHSGSNQAEFERSDHVHSVADGSLRWWLEGTLHQRRHLGHFRLTPEENRL